MWTRRLHKYAHAHEGQGERKRKREGGGRERERHERLVHSFFSLIPSAPTQCLELRHFFCSYTAPIFSCPPSLSPKDSVNLFSYLLPKPVRPAPFSQPSSPNCPHPSLGHSRPPFPFPLLPCASSLSTLSTLLSSSIHPLFLLSFISPSCPPSSLQSLTTFLFRSLTSISSSFPE